MSQLIEFPRYLVRKAGYTHDTARTGVVTLIQRFGSALNLNIHFPMLFLDGVYRSDGTAIKVIPCIEDPVVIKQILDHLKNQVETGGHRLPPESRAPPAELPSRLFD